MNIKENKYQIIDELLDAGNQCLLRFENRAELATEHDKRVAILYECFENFFFHGLKEENLFNSTREIINCSLSGSVENLNQYDYLNENSIRLWSFICFFLNKHKQERFTRLKSITSNIGKCRAWLRSSLNEHSLERYLQTMFEKESKVVEQFYLDKAALRDLERRNEILNLVYKLKSVLFASSIDNPLLNYFSKVKDQIININRFNDDKNQIESFDSLDLILTNEKKTFSNQHQNENVFDTDSKNKTRPNTPKLDLNFTYCQTNHNNIQTEEDKNLNEKSEDETNEPLVTNVLLTPIVVDNYSLDQFISNFEEDEKVSEFISNSCNTSCSSVIQSNNLIDNSTLSQAIEPESSKQDLIEKLNDLNNYIHKLENSNESLKKVLETFKKENFTLKKSLKKYIDAISLLKTDDRNSLVVAITSCKEIFPDEFIEQNHTLNNDLNLNQETFDTDAYFKYRDSIEYEKKLIKVAQMHGEIVEYNDCLQKIIMQKDATIKRLKDELIELRGPLPQSIQTSDENEICSIEAETDYPLLNVANETILNQKIKPLINIWIPSAFLADQKQTLNSYLTDQQHSHNKKISSYHVYQIYIHIKDDEWNVYRRYSQFYSVHQDLKKKHQKISFLEFPPKITIGNRHAKVVQERRKKLETYLRTALNILQFEYNIYDRKSLIEVLPFLSEKYYLNKSNKTNAVKKNENESNPGETIVQQQEYNGL